MMMGGGHGRLNSDAAAAILLAVLLGNLAISASCTTRQLLPGVAGGRHGCGRGWTAPRRRRREQDLPDILPEVEMRRRRPRVHLLLLLALEVGVLEDDEACRSICPVCDPKCHPPLPQAVRRLGSSMVAPVAGVYVRMCKFVGR
ncbi:hypothetical protein PAHAL_5G343300 [Panicum hallii]|uniref:Uncharacterized protein n=1 Tax=Panicum hallii TaxID=206008 RepID=A0A2S3HUS2_9POAL|nr:hypothetical protein PAHAL_5G343300 [Panicum hallii]